MTEAQISRVWHRISILIRPVLRKEIGDSTPAHYDKADRIVQSLFIVVTNALKEENNVDEGSTTSSS